MVTIDFSLLKVVSLSYGADPKKLLFYKKESPDKADPIPKDEVTTNLVFRTQLNPELSNTHIMSLCDDLGFPSVA